MSAADRRALLIGEEAYVAAGGRIERDLFSDETGERWLDPDWFRFGASTLPDELFHRFPAVETAEIHLATGFQNLLFDHPAFPEELQRKITAWCFENAADERKPDQTDEQFVYTTRKKAIGPFKRELWDLESRDEILAAQRRKVSFLFTELGVNGSREMVDAYIRPVEVHRSIPDALRGAVTAT